MASYWIFSKETSNIKDMENINSKKGDSNKETKRNKESIIQIKYVEPYSKEAIEMARKQGWLQIKYSKK